MESHPLLVAWQTRDVAAWRNSLAPDVVLYSPILRRPFEGREVVVELTEALFATFGRFEVVDSFVSGDTHAFFWRGELGGRTIEGTDLVRTNENGQIGEIKVMIRPLTDIALFAATAGPPMARRLGRIRAFVARLLGPPFRGFAALTDLAATRVVQRR